MRGVGVLLVIVGGAILLAGVLVLLAGRFPWLGRLPGDVHLRGKGWSFSFPVVTCILVSMALTVLLNLILRLLRK